MPSKRPEGKIDAIALSVARGLSLAAAAREVSVPESTARRWAADPGFPRRVIQIRQEIVSQSVGLLALLMIKAAIKLGKLIDDPDSEVRLKACRAVNADFLALHTHADLSERLDALEDPADGSG
ncbi:MAG: hypothetical protein LC745_00790 [Planctomycetia bacterium]|nr:hypothetical protein [Planctomycetia bacterium]